MRVKILATRNRALSKGDALAKNKVAESISLKMVICREKDELPSGLTTRSLAQSLHEWLKPYEDPVEQVQSGIKYALSREPGKGGFVLLGYVDERLVGAVVMLNTNMGGYIPENLLLFVAVDPEMRGNGLGARIIEKSFGICKGDVKLHVEYDNPAKRLYERLGMTNKYAEMRYIK